MEVSDTMPASVEELLVALALKFSSGSAVLVALTAFFVVGILDFKLPLLRRLGSDSSPGWLARFLPLPLIRSGAVASAATWSPFFGAAGFLRAGCRGLLALRAPETAASGAASAIEAGASEVRALMAVNPGMMIEGLRGSGTCEFACRTAEWWLDNALASIFASRFLAARS
jgi:hypothetical protein